MRWTVLLPMKSLPYAKARLAGASPDSAAHARLVAAIRADTVDAVERTRAVARVVVVTDRPATDGVRVGLVFVQHTAGLNAALSEAAADASARWPDDGVVALVADLPALRPGDLDRALRAAAGHPRSFVRDAAGTGTTMLAARPAVRLHPGFGAGSAARHAALAVEIDAAAGLRRDVDTAPDLAVARTLGVGPQTAALFAALPDGPPRAVRDARGAGR